MTVRVRFAAGARASSECSALVDAPGEVVVTGVLRCRALGIAEEGSKELHPAQGRVPRFFFFLSPHPASLNSVASTISDGNAG
jgi:hypothetical protein